MLFRQLVLLGMLGLIVPMSSGCIARGVKEGLGVFTGAEGVYVAIYRIPTGTMYDYGKIEFAPPTHDMGVIVPVTLTQRIPLDVKDRVAESKVLKGPKTLKIDADLIHYESDSTLGKVVGPLFEVVLRVRISDAETGQLLGVANIVGRSEALTSASSEDLSDGAAKGLVRWLEDSAKPK